jgi:hypothetical protein
VKEKRTGLYGSERRQAILGQLLKKKFLFISSMLLDKKTIQLAVAEEPTSRFPL